MGDAWRALAQEPDVCLKILIQTHQGTTMRFDPETALAKLDYTLVNNAEGVDYTQLTLHIQQFNPDVIYVVGWRAQLSRWIATSPLFKHTPRILIFDLPFAWTMKKIIAPIVLRPYLKHFCGCFVPGAKAAQYARWLGFKDGAGLGWVERKLFCANIKKFSKCVEQRAMLQHYPRQFLYVGRYVHEKGIDILIEAYQSYCEQVRKEGDSPWGLTFCGMGPLGHLLQHVQEVTDIGFQQPDALPRIFAQHGAFVLASRHEPWGVVLAEAAAAGLPIICTEACGASEDVIEKNGIICKTGCSRDVAKAMYDLHTMTDQARIAMGNQGLALAEQYSCEKWASHVVDMVDHLMKKGANTPCSPK